MAITVAPGTKLTGLQGNTLRILQSRQAWETVTVSQDANGRILIEGTRASKIFHSVLSGPKAAEGSNPVLFSAELRRCAINTVKWADPRIIGLQDATAPDAGLPADWSLIRDSSDGAIDKMFAIAADLLNATGCAATVRSGMFSIHTAPCARKGSTEAPESGWYVETFEQTPLPRLWCKQHNPVLRAEKEAEERATQAAETKARGDAIVALRLVKVKGLAAAKAILAASGTEEQQKDFEASVRAIDYSLWATLYPKGEQ